MEQRKDNPNYHKKPTNTELRRRLDIVESLLIDCASVPEIMRYFAEKENLKLARRTIEQYVHIVEKRIQRAAEPLRELEIRKAVRRFERCFARAISGTKKNVAAAIAAQKALNDLLGLNPPKDADDAQSMEQLAALIAVQYRQMDEATLGPASIRDEIFMLLDRLKESGEDVTGLAGEIVQRIGSRNGPSLTA
jgi:chromosome condensin MukBEF ATPase and DNA-binding subunit MukB